MKLSKKWFGLAVGTVALATVALVGTAIVPQSASAHGGPDGFGRGGIMAPGANNTYLADALGITTDELATAQEEATDAALVQAVEEGLITQTQADLIKERSAYGRGLHIPFLGRFGSSTIDMDALFADALGITTDELQAARTEASNAALDAAVEAGDITQEQADQMKAHHALQQYLQDQGLEDSVRTLYENAVNDAVAAGVITQEQADQILSSQSFGFGPHGFGMHGFGGHGGRGGFGGFRTAPPTDSSNVTPSAFYSF